MSLIKLSEYIAGFSAETVVEAERAFCKDVLLAAASQFFPDRESNLLNSLMNESVSLDPFLDESADQDEGRSVMARKIEEARRQFVFRFKELAGIVLAMHLIYGMDVVAPTDIEMAKRIEFENAAVVWVTWFQVSRMSRNDQDRYLVAILTRHIPEMREKQHRGEPGMEVYIRQHVDLVHGLSGQELTQNAVDMLWNEARQFALRDRPIPRH
jgi:hypothetical protein